MLEKLAWEITPEERRDQISTFVSRTWFLLVALAVIIPLLYFSTFLEIVFWGIARFLNTTAYSVVGVVIAIGGFFLINKFFRYKKRSYLFDDLGIKISKGKKEKMFSWSEFEYFYSYSSRFRATTRSVFSDQLAQTTTGMKKHLQDTESTIEGEIFYLKRTPVGLSRICKIFVVVHTEPTNTGKVLDFLRQHLPEKQMTGSSDLGLVFYQFK